MTKHWKRRLEVDVGGTHLTLHDLQVEFQVRQAVNPQPDWAYMRITNLSDKTSNAIWRKNAAVQINAGYFEGPFGMLFDGNVDDMRRGKQNGTDKYHDILATTGHKPYSWATVTDDSLKAGSTMEDAAKVALREMEKMGVTGGYFDPALKSITLPRAWPINAHARDVLAKVAESTNTSWFIFNNQLHIVSNKEGMPGSSPVISAKTGLIGVPEQQLQGIVVRVLMNPNYRLYQKVKIDAEIEMHMNIGPFGPQEQLQKQLLPNISPKGEYQIIRIDHDGNTRANSPWYTTLTCMDPSDPGAGPITGGARGNALPRSIPENEDQNQGGSGGGASGGF